MRKGIVLAGGSGTRLHPMTLGISKQLLPIYDKPMIYYSISALFLAGIREILIISTRRDLPAFEDLLGDGSQFGVSFSYAVQEEPEGLPQALTIGADFLSGSPVCLVLGDNVFFGPTFSMTLKRVMEEERGATIFAYHVADPERYGVLEFDGEAVVGIEEKPKDPKSSYVATGLYFFNEEAVELARGLTKSARGEYEITDLLKIYMERGELAVEKLRRGFAWLDTGTHDSLLKAGNFVQTMVELQDLQVACLEEIAWRNGWVSDVELSALAGNYGGTAYGAYMAALLEE